MDNLESEGRSLPQENQIFRVIYGKIGFLICTENPTFHPQDGNIQETKVFNTVKENITKLNFFGSRDTSVTSARTIAT